MELEALQDVYEEIKGLGAELVAVCPQRQEHLTAIVNKNSLTFDIVHDVGNNLAEAFGLKFKLPDYIAELYAGFGIDLLRVNGDDSLTLPMPARFVIGQNGVIASADFDPDYTIRPEPAKTVEDLKRLMAETRL
jgi:peroxiredoxin